LASLQEPFALVLCEARQMGCAIIATRVGGSPEALWHGQKGRLVSPSAPDEMASAILAFIDDDAERRRFARAAGEDTDDIHVGRMARETLSVYDEMLAGVHRNGGASRPVQTVVAEAEPRRQDGDALPT
jgi:glycosyltransferase involved in cell wall biosynthesis